MQIVICHLTRMEYPYICVAGIDLETLKFVRLVPPRRQRIQARFLKQHSGPFAVGACIDPGPTSPVGVPPEVEDHECLPHMATVIRQLPPDEFWNLLCNVAVSDFSSAFGTQPIKGGRSYHIPAGQGTASLCCMKASNDIYLFVDDRLGGKGVRLARKHGSEYASLPVTDLRFYKDSLNYPVDESKVQSINNQLRQGTRAALTLGLTRPFAQDEAHEPVHWVQINGVHLAPSS
jgi:hypothetical protein